MGLGYLEIVNGIFSIVIVCIFALVGLKIASIYKKAKDKVYILIGLTWILIASPWYSSSISFIVALFNYGQGLQDLPLLYFMIAIPLIPVTIVIFVSGFTEMKYKEHKWKIRIIFIILSLTIELLIMQYFILVPTRGIRLETPVNARYSLMILLYIVICFGVFWGIGLSLAISTIRLGTPENKLKGYFILAAMILFIIGAVLDALIFYTDLLLLIPRFILIASALCFYLGFITPKFLKKKILK